MKRNGKTLKTVPDGAPRRMADGKNAVRKMNESQRALFMTWAVQFIGEQTTPSWACRECKSTDVQVQAWVNANTGAVEDDTGSYSWCNGCASEQKYLDSI